MKPLTSVLFCVLFSFYVLGQEYEQDMHSIKGQPTKAILSIKKGKLHYHSGWKYVYRYFDFGKIRTQENYERGSLRAIYSYGYDVERRRILENTIDVGNRKDTTRFFLHVYNLDSIGRIKKEQLNIHRDKTLWIRDSISYADFNLPTGYRKIYPAFSSDGKATVETHLFTYNERQLLDTFKMLSNTGDFQYIQYEYNDHGDVAVINAEQRIIDSDGKKIEARRKIEYTYKYDNFGNWTKRFTRVDQAEKELELTRKIKYKK